MATEKLLKEPRLKFEGNCRRAQLMIRVVAPNDPSAIQWVEKNAAFLNSSSHLFNDIEWGTALLSNEEPSNTYTGNHPEYAIYKTHREIADLAKSHDAKKSDVTQDVEHVQRSIHALISTIVWRAWAGIPDLELAVGHILEIRRALRYLIENGVTFPDLNHPMTDVGWLQKFIEAHPNKKRRPDLLRLKSYLTKGARVGERKNDPTPFSPDVIVEDIWNDYGSKPRVNADVFQSKAGFDADTTQVPSIPLTRQNALGRDDSEPTDRITIVPSRRHGSDARYHARYLDEVRLIANVKGYDRFETYTDHVAGQLLSKLSPASPSGILAFVAMVLGRDVKEIREITAACDNALVVASTQEPTKSLRLQFPFDPTACIADSETARKQFKKYTLSIAEILGSRISLGGLSRFGVMRFHGDIGIVQSEQLQGRMSLGSVTAIYARLSEEAFQGSLNEVLIAALSWLANSAPYVGSNWKDWATALLAKGCQVSSGMQIYGSNRVEELDGNAISRAKCEMRDAFKIYRMALDENARNKACLAYLKLSALALHTSFMSITGARPVSAHTQIALLNGSVSLADKQCYGDIEARMVPVPEGWLTSANNHFSNVLRVATRLDPAFQFQLIEIRHPFIYFEVTKLGEIQLGHLKQSDARGWLARITGTTQVSANALRHSIASQMLEKNIPDGFIAHQLGHDRGSSSVSSKYRSTPALLPSFGGVEGWEAKVEVLK